MVGSKSIVCYVCYMRAVIENQQGGRVNGQRWIKTVSYTYCMNDAVYPWTALLIILFIYLFVYVFYGVLGVWLVLSNTRTSHLATLRRKEKEKEKTHPFSIIMLKYNNYKVYNYGRVTIVIITLSGVTQLRTISLSPLFFFKLGIRFYIHTAKKMISSENILNIP